MTAEPYKERLLQHLGVYRREQLGVIDPGVFRYRGQDMKVEHVLPKEHGWLNIPSETRSVVQAYVARRKLRLHRYFHHLNSSQAFALSLFVPYFEGAAEASTALLAALGQRSTLESWEAEAIPDPAEATNLDARWSTSDGVETFCEVKLTEAEFGTASDDAVHRAKLESIYAPRLSGVVDPSLLAPREFFKAYQILRNLWHAAGSQTARLVFIYPRQHTVLTRALSPVLEKVSPSLRNRVRVVYVEDVLDALRDNQSCPDKLRAYAGILAEKYLPRTL